MGQVAAGASLLFTGASLVQQRKATVSQDRALRAQRRLERVRARRERRDQVRAARIIQAQTIAASEASGIGDSSTLFGNIASIKTQAAENLSFLDTSMAFQNRILQFNQDAARQQGYAQLFGTAASVAGQAASATGGYDKLFKIG